MWTNQSVVDHVYHLLGDPQVKFMGGWLWTKKDRRCVVGWLCDEHELRAHATDAGVTGGTYHDVLKWPQTGEELEGVNPDLLEQLMIANDNLFHMHRVTWARRRQLAQTIRLIAQNFKLEDPARAVPVDWEVAHVDQSVSR